MLTDSQSGDLLQMILGFKKMYKDGILGQASGQATINKPESADERYFIAHAFARRSHAQRDLVVRIALFYNAIAMAVVPFVGKATLVNYVVSIHACLFLTALISFVRGPYRENLDSLFVSVWLMAPAVVNYVAASYHIAENDVPRIILTASTAIICSGFMLLIDPRGVVARAISAVVCIAIAFWSFSENPGGNVMTFVNGVAILGTLGISFIHDRDYRDTTKREYKLLIQAAPAKIVRQSASSNVDVDMVFGPKHRHCVCISTDWRDYQAMSASMPAEKLAAAIGAYYDMCDRLLGQIFLEGNYYSDWIADEFFLVVFAKDQDDEKRIVNLALEFAMALIKEKENFARDNGVPAGIDVGVSSGLALIGMMGPAGHRKATALGDVPGLARRLQGIGKLIRQKHGDADRIVFGSATLMEITEPVDVSEFVLEEKAQLRNIESDSVFYIEPAKVAYKVAV